MPKLYEIFKVLKIQKRIVSAETIHGNTVCPISSSVFDHVMAARSIKGTR
jgi:hypothetical protein